MSASRWPSWSRPTPYLAEDAVSLISAEIEDLPPVLNWEQAGDRSIFIHDGAGTNTPASTSAAATPMRRSRLPTTCGASASAFSGTPPFPWRRAGLSRSGTAHEQRMTVFGITKVPFFNRTMLASMLDLPESSVVMKVADAGGGFGVRGEFYPEDFLIPALARKLNRPVKWIEDRREHFLATNHSRETTCDLEIACDRNGTILGLRGEVTIDIGAYARGTGGTSPTRCAQFLPGPYRIPNFACKVNAHVSNKTPSGTYRGPGRVEANFFRERLIDIAAADLGIDPADIRRRNFVTAQEMPFNIGRLVTYEEPAQFDSGDFGAVLRAGAAGDRLDREARHPRPQDRRLVPWHRFCIVRREQRRRLEREGQDPSRIEWDARRVCRLDQLGTGP